MNYQVWFSCNAEPALTQDDWDLIREKTKSFSLMKTGVRNLWQGLANKEVIIAIFYLLQAKGKEPKIFRVQNQEGLEYGFQNVEIGVDENGNPIYEIQPILQEGQTLEEWQRINFPQENFNTFPENEADYNNEALVPVVIDDEGTLANIKIKNTIWGWNEIDFLKK